MPLRIVFRRKRGTFLSIARHSLGSRRNSSIGVQQSSACIPRAENELREDAGTNVILLRSADDFLDALLNPDKRNKPSSDLNTTIPEL